MQGLVGGSFHFDAVLERGVCSAARIDFRVLRAVFGKTAAGYRCLGSTFQVQPAVAVFVRCDRRGQFKRCRLVQRFIFHRADAGIAVAGGVAGAIEACLKEYYPNVPVHIEHAESLAECKKVLALAKAGKLNGCMIEGMACPGGCMGGAGTNVPVAKSSKELKKFLASCSKKLPPKGLVDIELN